MRTMRRIAALVLTLCMLVGLPMVVQATETTDEFRVVKVEEMSASDATAAGLPAGRTVLVYFNNTPSTKSLSADQIGLSPKPVGIRIRASKGGNHEAGVDPDLNGSIVAASGDTITVTFGDNKEKNFPAMRAAGYDKFVLAIRENGSGTTADAGYIKGFTDTNGKLLMAPDGTVDKYDEVATPIGQDCVARIGTTYYDTFDNAIDAAQPGNTVTLLRSEKVKDTLFVLDADVTLDLNGWELSVKHVMAFGHIVDSTEGDGKMIVTASSRVNLLSDNAALPLFDTDGYRFFSYRLTSVGTKTTDDLSKVTYGIKVHFDAPLAYELLANEANDDVVLAMNITTGNNRFIYKFTPKVYDALKQKVMDKQTFAERNEVAITLTVSGLDIEDPDFEMKASPALYAACNTASLGKTVTYEGHHDSYTRAKNWIEEQIEDNTLFSFDYAGQDYATHIGNWTKTVEKTDAGWTVTYTYGDVVAKSEIFLDVETASVEWTNYFENNGNGNSPIIANIQAIDSSVAITDPTLTTTKGSSKTAEDFQPFSEDLSSEPFSMATTNGLSSSGAWPYFDIVDGKEEYGIMGAIGWTGNWKADFAYNEGWVDITAGMKTTRISLYAGEQMRTPMIMLQFFKGDQDDGHNAFRQLILKSYTPADASGKPITHAPLSLSSTTEISLGEDKLIGYAEEAEDCDYEIFWMDAGWFGEGEFVDNKYNWGTEIGNWYFIPNVYLNGNVCKFRQYLKDRDAGLLLWFEPERAKSGTKLAKEHLKWMLSPLEESFNNYLYDFSDDEACDYMIKLISKIIRDNELTWYRQDLNNLLEIGLGSYWAKKDSDSANREGMTEIKYITNLYRYMDTLIKRNPGLLIDNCASGGRRLDLEMMRRSVPLWNSDYLNQKDSNGTKICTYDEARSINYNLSWWLPIHAGGWVWNETNTNTKYAFRGDMNSGMTLVSVIAKNSLVKNTLLEQYFDCRELMNGDYYILASGKNDTVNTEDACYEFYKEEQEKGYLLAFRPEQCTTESETYKLKGLDAKATYEIEWVDSGVTETYTGQQLMENGLTVHYPNAYSALLIYINKI